MENENKEMHGVWIRTLAVKNGYGKVMLYGLTIGGIENLLQKGSRKGVVVELDLSLESVMT